LEAEVTITGLAQAIGAITVLTVCSGERPLDY
jgi:hypothetical protein